MKDKSDIWLYIFTAVIFFTLLVIIWTHAIYLSSDNFAQAIWSEMKLLGAAIENWQTLFTGILALGGAIATVWIVRRQIQITEKAREETRKRKLRAAKSTLPIHLREILGYSETILNFLAPAQKLKQHGKTIKLAIEYPALPYSAILGIEKVIEFCDFDSDTADTLAILVSMLQVHYSRHHSLEKEFKLSDNNKKTSHLGAERHYRTIQNR